MSTVQELYTVYSPSIDGTSNKIKKIPLSRFWSPPVAEVGILIMVGTIRATRALIMVGEKDCELWLRGGFNRALWIINKHPTVL